jgi:hypothetical protein
VSKFDQTATENERTQISDAAIPTHTASETWPWAMAAKAAVSNPRGDVHIKTSVNQHPVKGFSPMSEQEVRRQERGDCQRNT